MKDDLVCINYRKHKNRLRDIRNQDRTTMKLIKGEDMIPQHRHDIEKLKKLVESITL